MAGARRNVQSSRPIASVRLTPGVNAARNGDRPRPALGHRAAWPARERGVDGRGGTRRPLPLSVTALPRSSVPDDPEGIAAEPAHVPRHDRERGVRGDGCVDGAAAGAQDEQAGLRGEMMRAGDGAMTATNGAGRDGRGSGCAGSHGHHAVLGAGPWTSATQAGSRPRARLRARGSRRRPAPERLGQVPHDGQAQAGASTGARRVGPVEAIEDVRERSRGDAGTVVADRQRHGAGRRLTTSSVTWPPGDGACVMALAMMLPRMRSSASRSAVRRALTAPSAMASSWLAALSLGRESLDRRPGRPRGCRWSRVAATDPPRRAR